MDRLSTALRQYEREQHAKKGVLLLPDGGYYLFDRQFCGISEYEISLAGQDIQIQGNSVPCGLFFGAVDDTLNWCVKDTGDFQLESLSLIFHIALGDEEDLLRGILFIRQKSAHSALFTDPDVEKLYRAVRQPVQTGPPARETNETLTNYARSCARDDLHKLTALCLHGNKLSQLRKRMEAGNQ